MDVKRYLISKLKEYDSEINVQEGSAYMDLFINPVSSILSETIGLKNTVNVLNSIDTPSAISEDNMDMVAANYLVERAAGSKSSGYIRFYYSTPTYLSVPKGTQISTSDGKVFEVTVGKTITYETMLSNNDALPYYHTGDIAIEASTEGTAYNVKAGTITKLISAISPTPVYIRNPLPMAAGTEKETNDELKEKILNNFNNKSLSSDEGIKSVLKDFYPNISSVEVIGPGQTEMTRDIIYSGQTLNSYYTTDFASVISGLHSYPFNENIAYLGVFKDTDETTTIALPEHTDFIYEFTNTMYAGIAKDNDTNYAEITTYEILVEPFSNNSYADRWIASDSLEDFGELVNTKEIKAIDNELRLGYTKKVDEATNVILPVIDIERFLAALRTEEDASEQALRESLDN